MRRHEPGNFIRHTSCPACGSSDANAEYDNDTTYCFSCSTWARVGADQPTTHREKKRMSGDLLPFGEYRELKARGISEKTCKFFGYSVGTLNGKPVQIAPYRDASGTVVAQHIRGANKEFCWRGDVSDIGLFGQDRWPDGGRMVVVVEGEIDALSLAEIQDRKWPVVSISCGAAQPGHTAKVEKYIAKYTGWLSRFEVVVFCFDMDEAGRASAISAAKLLPPGKAKIASLPLKDANEMLLAGRGAELISALWNAKAYRPDGLVTVSEIAERAKKPIPMGLPWPWKTLTDLTYGRRRGELYGIGAGTGIGKSDVLAELLVTQVELGLPTGIFSFESSPVDIVLRTAGKQCGRTFHIPDSGWTQDELDKAIDSLSESDLLHIYDHQGSTEWEAVAEHIRYLAQHLGVKDFIVDPLTAFTAQADNESDCLKSLMEKLSSLAKNLHCSIYFVSHLSTPEGKPHEEGGRVTIRNFRGSRAIGYWSNFLFGLERDQQNEDQITRRTTTVRVLKDRYTGRANGETFELLYDPATGRLSEKENNPFGDATSDNEVCDRSDF